MMIPFVLFILAVLLSMPLSAVIYFYNPSSNMLITLVAVNMMWMWSAGFFFLVEKIWPPAADKHAGSGGESVGTTAPHVERTSAPWKASVSGLVIVLFFLDEFFMGWAFLLASGTESLAADPLIIFSQVVGSYWFLFTMSFEMAMTTFFLRKELSRNYLYLVGMQSVVMFLSPTAISSTSWMAVSVYASSVTMIVLYIYVFEHLARNRTIPSHVSGYLLSLMSAYGVMMAGLYVWELTSSGALFTVSILLEMVIYLNLVLGGKKDVSMKQWHSRPWWILGVLSALFVGEFFMGALLDAQAAGPQAFVSSISLVPIAGGNMILHPAAAVYDFMTYFAAVTLSPWYLIMMGAEMGALVVFRMRRVRELETRIRLGLVIVAYGIYSVLLPSFLVPGSLLPRIPFLGWSMGVGTAGPVAPSLLVGLAGTYLVSGSLSFLFGSRQVCSVFCTAALMYQGTFYDSMKTFNRSSSIGRKYLTSKLSRLYKSTFTIVWVSLFAAVAVSYLDSVGILNLFIFGSDPTSFLYTFYFGFLWYLIFVTIPLVGTYACVSMGWCHWGTFNQLVGRLGFFKLKVKDPSVCVTCKTKDCAKACPVGLTDLPGSFIAKGEFKSSKCIGVGDCVNACPYSNEYFFDVRHWLRGRGRGKKDRELPIMNDGAVRMGAR